MSHPIFDIRVDVTRKLSWLQKVFMGGQEAYLSGLLSGLKVQGNLMMVSGVTTFDEEMILFIKSGHKNPLDKIVREYNANEDHKVKLNHTWFIGEAQRQSRFSDQYYEGLSTGMEYVSQLYWSFRDEGDSKVFTAGMAYGYLQQVIEWVTESLYLRSHIHSV